jgi:hypothetical protein
VTHLIIKRWLNCIVCVATVGLTTVAFGADEIKLNNGMLTMTQPEGWKKVEVRSRIIEAEFSIPKAMDDKDDGRLTFMAAGGGVDANIERWKSQFDPAKGEARIKSSVEKSKIGDAEVHMVDIEGTFKSQSGGPLGPTDVLEGYRLMGAIIVQANGNEYYVKLTGPAKTIEENTEKFQEMIKSLKTK